MGRLKDFVLANENADVTQLLLSSKGDEDFDIDLAVNIIEVRRKLKSKVPSWYGCEDLVYPFKLGGEQCSSEATALYKAGIVSRLFPGNGSRCRLVADFTGGLGVDSWAFSKVADRVIYNEMNTPLARASAQNFSILGADNIKVVSRCLVPSSAAGQSSVASQSSATGQSSKTLSSDGSDHSSATGQSSETLPSDGSDQSSATGQSSATVPSCGSDQSSATAGDILVGETPDLIFLDPARRSDSGRKVFLIEDCRPDILALKDDLFRESRYIMVKLSPMADISMLLDRLGSQCRELHVLSAGGECKELIVLMDREWSGDCKVIVASAGCGNPSLSPTSPTSVSPTSPTAVSPTTPMTVSPTSPTTVSPTSPTTVSDTFAMTFSMAEIKGKSPLYITSAEEAAPGRILFEPGKSLMKAGAFGPLCRRFPLKKLGRSTHYFLLEESPEPASDSVLEILFSLGKFFEIKEVYPLNNRTLKEVGRKYPRSEVIARNLPMDTALFRKKLGVASGDDAHILGLKIDAGPKACNVIIVARQIHSL